MESHVLASAMCSGAERYISLVHVGLADGGLSPF